MNEHRYILDKSSKKYHCPKCTKRLFVRYIDIESGDYLPNHYGRCDRESKCAYYLNPYLDGYAKIITIHEQGQYSDNWKPQRKEARPKPDVAFIPVDVLKQTLKGYEQNVFIQNLLNQIPFPFEVKDIENVISLYYLGTVSNGYRAGAITFPFIDFKGNIRAIQVKQFDESNHTTGTDFLHSIIEKYHIQYNKPILKWLEAYNKNETKVSCLFGEHLLNKYPLNPVALVEAPKTAVYGTLYFGFPEQPENLIWIAVYNLSSLNLAKCKALQGRDVYLFPDLSKEGKAFELWSERAKTIESQLPGARFVVSDLLERLAPEPDKKKGNDLADYLIKQDWRLFRKKQPEPVATSISKKCEPLKKTFSQVDVLPKVGAFKPKRIVLPEKEQPESWEQEISELETYFATVTLPTRPVMLNQCSTVTNVSLFIDSHFQAVKANNGNPTFLPCLNRLQELKNILGLNGELPI